MLSQSERTHPDPETLAAFVEGRLDSTAKTRVVEHLDRCDACTDDVAVAMKAPRDVWHRWRTVAPWLIATAAVLLIVTVPAIREAIERPFRGSPVDRLIALAPSTARLVEPRLTGGFRWAQYHGPLRGNEEQVDAAALRLSGAAGELIERSARDSSAAAQHAAGVALILVQKSNEAVARLESAARGTRDATLWSDLAAAQYEAALRQGRAALYPEALASADAALRIDQRLPEALFNRALVLEKMGLTDEARRAWQRCLEVDGSSAWAAEARAHLADLPTGGSSRFDRDRPAFEQAAERGDAPAVRAFVDVYRARVGAYGEAEYLGRWGDAWRRGDAVEGKRWLTIARAIGETLPQLTGESLLRDAVRVIESASPPQLPAIAEAHAAYRRGRIAYSQQGDAAERDLREAARRFASTRSPMVLLARYYAASALLARNHAGQARAELEQIRAEGDKRPEYIGLGAHVRWELARAYIHLDDSEPAVPLLAQGAAMFRQLGDTSSEAFMRANLAAALTSLGRTNEAWAARTSAFAALSTTAGDSGMLAASLAAAADAELRTGRYSTALALSSVGRSVAEAHGRPLVVADALINEALLEAVAGDPANAVRTARRAEEVALRIPDSEVRARALAGVAVADGAARLDADPAGAAVSLARAIDFYRAHHLDFGLPEPLLLRARGARRAGDLAGAARDLDEGMAIVERHPVREAGVVLGVGVLHAEQALFTEAIRISLDAGDAVRAFAIVERSRGTTATIAQVQRQLRATGTVVIELVALPDEIVTFAIADAKWTVARRPRTIERWNALADASFSADGTSAAAALYDDVIRPVEGLVGGARQLVIVPDARLTGTPFSALYDAEARRYLIERAPIAVAASAGALRDDARGTRGLSVAAIGLPTGGGSNTVALPDAQRELADVAAAYRRASTVPATIATLAVLRHAEATADVIHLAGHTTRQPGAGDQVLVFAAASPGGTERVSWKTILAAPFARTSVVVLAACETLRSPSAVHAGAMSLGAAFVAAGASDVIGTLTPIPDRDALALFIAVHRRMAAGESPARALRHAQLEAIRYEKDARGARSWRAVALLTGRIPRPSPTT